MRFLTGVVVLAVAATSQAATWTMRGRFERLDRINADGLQTNYNSHIALDPFAPGLISYELRRADGTLTSSLTSDGQQGGGTPINGSSLESVVAPFTAGPWQLDMTTTQGASRYSLSFGIRGNAITTFPYISSFSPAFGQNVLGGRTATYAWTAAGRFEAAGFFPGFGNAWEVIDPQPASQTRNLYVPGVAGPRSLAFFLDYSLANDVFLRSATLISGVDQGTFEPKTGRGYTLGTSYNVVIPEPATLGALTTIALGTLCRRRRPRVA